MTQAHDIFFDSWIITRRIDSGHGVDLLYGRQPDSESGSTWHLIVTKELEEFILENLATFPQLDLPIGQIRKVRLRRMISSRRYKNLADWEENRAPDEDVFWVDPEHIELPEVHDIHDIPYLPSELRYFRPGFPIWTGINDTPREKGERRVREHILTPQLAELLYQAIDVDPKELDSLGLPLSREAVRRLRLKALAHFKPEMIDYKTDTEDALYRKRYVGNTYILMWSSKTRRLKKSCARHL